MPSSRHRVLIVGGGFGGLSAAKALGRDDRVMVTVVDRRNHHLFTPLLYQVATGAVSPGDIAQPLRSILRRQRNTTVLLGEAVGLDVERREVLLADGGPLAYDTLIVAAGARFSYFGHDEWSGDRARPEVAGRRARDPAQDPHRLRGRGARARPGPAGRVDVVRPGRRWADRRGARRSPRRDRPRHAPPRLPLDRHGGRADPARRGDGPDPADLSAGPVPLGEASARAPRGDRPDRRPRRRPRRSLRHGRGRRRDAGDDPDADRALGGRHPRRRVRRRGREGRRRAHRSLRPDPRRARPHRAGPPRDLRRRGRGRDAVEAGPAGARRRPGRRSRADATRPGRSSPASTESPSRHSATSTAATSRSSGACPASPTSRGSGRSGARAASRPGRCGSGST